MAVKPVIKAQNVNFIYNKGKSNEWRALININLSIYPEEFVIVFGPSGCGKSTLLNVIAGLERPDNGSIFAFDRDLSVLSKKDFALYHRAQIGMIYQSYNLINSLTVLENVALPQIFVNVSKHKREMWAKELLKRFGILEQAKKIPTELSGGQQQRIGIARAIANNPQIILADEPVGNLDSVSAQNVLSILEKLNTEEKKTIVMVTHNPEHLDSGDRIIYMKDGIITREVVNREKHKNKEKEELVLKSPTAEINDLMRAYHGLSPEQINILIMPYKAKVFAHHFITSRNMEETKMFEDVIQRRLLGTISRDEFRDILNRSSAEGGVGFDKRTAEKILRRVHRVIRAAFFTYQGARQRKGPDGKHIKITNEEKAEKVTIYLLKTCYNEYYSHLNEAQINRLKNVVKDRLTATVQKSKFYNFLDKPFSEGGVGLNSKTAKAITEELELILILGFGIIQMLEPFSHKDNQDIEAEKQAGAEPELKDPEKEMVEAGENRVEEIGTADKAEEADTENEPEKAASNEDHKEDFAPETGIESADEADTENGPEAAADDHGGRQGDTVLETELWPAVPNRDEEAENGPEAAVDNPEIVQKTVSAPSLEDAIQAAQEREEEIKTAGRKNI